MLYELSDFNNAKLYFDTDGADCWRDIVTVISSMPVFLQGSQQSGIIGNAIFDPKATNSFLTETLRTHGWKAVPVPPSLTEFGVDWDGGKGTTLAEWQFSNYPFLWNNVIRTEAVVKSGLSLAGFGVAKALIVITKSGLFPSSNSTLYYEQAHAQLKTVTQLGAFDVPIRLVGLSIPQDARELDVVWSAYPGRYSRAADAKTNKRLAITWRGKNRYGQKIARFSELSSQQKDPSDLL